MGGTAGQGARGRNGCRFYQANCFERTKGYIEQALDRPDLAVGVNWTARYRVSCFWTAYKAAGAGLLPPEFDQQCPSCGEAVRDTREHLCLECPAYAAPRHTHLVGLLQAIEAWAGDAGLGGLSRSELVTLLLGGSVRGSEPPGLWLGASRAQMVPSPVGFGPVGF